MILRIGDLVVKKLVNGSKPTLVVDVSVNYDGWWIKTEQEPNHWIQSSVFELVATSQDKNKNVRDR